MNVELEGSAGGEGEEIAQEVIAEASELGWVPLDKFKGDPDKWVDAEAFVERGKHIMPILRKNNEKLRADLLKRDTEIGTLRTSLAGVGKTLERLEASYNEGLQRRLAEQEADLRRQLAEARRDSDVDEEVRLETELDTVRTASAEAKKLTTTKVDVAPVSTADEGLHPEFVAWKEENPWFGVDQKKTKAILRAAEDLRDEGSTLKGAEFFDKAAEIAFETAAPKTKVETGSPRGNNGPTGGNKSYSNLPKEAQEACMQDQETFVGPGKKFKDVKEWQAYYAKVYHGEPV